MQHTSLLETTQNTRDLGGYRKTDGTLTQPLSLVRSDVQKYPSERDVAFLRDNGITTIVDMRREKDMAKTPSKFAEADGFIYIACPIEEDGSSPTCLSEIPPCYMRIAQAENMAAVFRSIANADSGVLFHCTAGKDRTGVLSAILLMLVGVESGTIIEDYVLTAEYGRARFEAIRQKFPDADMNLVIPCRANMEGFLRLFTEAYGDAESYLHRLGLTETEIARIKEKL
ncbi:MAG: tyrosine-protein phosphatase [Clostridia bacterium]|nr:tyrosine-protein phosphatase [Clostridia bacterium]